MDETHYVIRGGAPGRERLRVLARVVWPTTSALLARVGVAPGMTCLDVGCGGGDVTIELARLVGSAGRVIGIDGDATTIELARREAAALNLSQVELRTARVGEATIEGAFDVVYARFLLTHLEDP